MIVWNKAFKNWSSESITNATVDEAMKARIQLPVPDLEIEHEAVFTWNIENYRGMSHRERSPKFDCGGHPWYGFLVISGRSSAGRES